MFPSGKDGNIRPITAERGDIPALRFLLKTLDNAAGEWYNDNRRRCAAKDDRGAALTEAYMLEKGMKAPAFTLPDSDGKSVSLSDFAGKTVVLYFYPKDNTPGCTRQACAFKAKNDEFKAKNAVIIGVSKDSSASHARFAEKYGLPFILLSDENLDVIKAYGVWQEKKLYGKVSYGVVRTTFVIDGDGVITAVMPKVKPDTNAEEVLAML